MGVATALHPDSPKDVATLSLKVLKDSESAARPMGRYLLHASAVVCLVLPPAVAQGFCFMWCPVSSHPPAVRGSGLGQKSLPRRNCKHIGESIGSISSVFCRNRTASRKEGRRRVAVMGMHPVLLKDSSFSPSRRLVVASYDLE